MAITRIKSNSSEFLQPNLGEIVSVVLDPGIDWLRIGGTIHIPEAGIYKIINKSGFVYQLKLKTAIIAPGEDVKANIIYPVNDDNAATAWGGNGKEW